MQKGVLVIEKDDEIRKTPRRTEEEAEQRTGEKYQSIDSRKSREVGKYEMIYGRRDK